MNDHHFNVLVAKDFDVDTAVFLNNMAYWTNQKSANKKSANKENFFENRYWIYNSYSAWPKIFPYWTSKQMRRIIDNAVKNGLLIKGCFNKKKYDNTNWYSLTNKALEYYPLLKEQILNEPAQTGKPESPNGQTYTNNKPDNKHTTTQQEFSSKSLKPEASPIDLITVFQEELPDNPCASISSYNGEIEGSVLKAMNRFKKEWFSIYKKPLSKEEWRFYLQKMKSDCEGFCFEIMPRIKMRNGLKNFLNWEILQKLREGKIK